MKKLYFRMYQDKHSIKYTSVIVTKEMMLQEINYWSDEMAEDEDPPIFEPVFMTEEDFLKLPEFEGF